MKNNINEKGFTLVEIAVVLVIVSLLIGSFIGSFAERIETTHIDNAKKELIEIKQVLMAYAYTKSPLFLPCPDITVPPDGEGDDIGGVCSAGTAVGTLPWRDLGMAQADVWGNRYSYWVNTEYANNTIGFNMNTGDANSASINTRINNNVVTIVPNAVAVVFSRGKNGLGGISIEGVNRDVIPAFGNGHDDELENADANSTFMSRFYTDEGVASAGGAFDDILVWINSYELKAKMVQAGVLP
jgi:prepilin-type N-terminal cleavage/methylation domain-containing protein